MRLTQLCGKHIPKRKKFLDQAVRAGKDKELAEMEANNKASRQKHVYHMSS